MNLAAAYRAAVSTTARSRKSAARSRSRRGSRAAHFQLGVTFMFMGRLNEAIGELETAVKIGSRGQSRGSRPIWDTRTRRRAGRSTPADALKELESRARQQYVSSFGIALIYDALGEKEPALAAFERAYQDRAVEFAQMTQYPPFKTIASEPRFQARMRRIGLPR